MRTADADFAAVSLEGGLFTRDLLDWVAQAHPEVPGIRPEDYHLAAGERLGDAALRRWDYLRGAYRAFRSKLAAGAAGAAATSLTRKAWLQILLNECGYGQVEYVGRIGPDDAISHLWRGVPIHLVGWERGLDQRLGAGKKKDRAPQSMVQEFLDRSEDRLWGILSNGRQLRILRDSTALVGASYIQFDLEAIFDGELYSDFAVLLAFLHSSRFEVPERADGRGSPADCWLERWRSYAAETGIAAGDKLRAGVHRAMEELGTGFLEANPALRAQLANGPSLGGISADEFRHELLRLAYQLIFLFVVEDRGALHPEPPLAPAGETAAARAELEALATRLAAGRQRYATYFSTARLRRIASRRRGDRHGDLWRALVLVLEALGSDGGRPDLALPALGGLYFRGGEPDGDTADGGNDDPRALPDLLRDCELPNSRLLSAVRLLSHVSDGKGRLRRVDFAHLGGAELGSVYESLLELVPRPDVPRRRFRLEEVTGNERKTTGSYFTPADLVDSLLDSALDPVIETCAASGDPDDLLRLAVLDPACGSGHFLVAAARRIARRCAVMHTGDDEPTRKDITRWLGEVVRRCIYGVDINPLAVEIAKFSLWLESIEPGRPLAFLDHHVKVGNALLGVTPRLLDQGIPDTAFKAVGGDEPERVRVLRAENHGAFTLDGVDVTYAANIRSREEIKKIAGRRVTSLSDVREQARRYHALEQAPDMRRAIEVADAWCAAFVWPKRAEAPPAITTPVLRRLQRGTVELPVDSATLLREISGRYSFFHWHLEFPDVFGVGDPDAPDANPDTGWQGGFDCVLGNPPWERVKLQEKEFFAARNETIAGARNAATRKDLIEQLATSADVVDRELYAEFQDRQRESAGWSQLLRDSDRYPLTGKGDVNTYAVFAETARTLLDPKGRSGLVLPTGIATDATTATFFGDLVKRGRLASLLEFENEEFVLSRSVDHRVRFCLLTVGGPLAKIEKVAFAFGSRRLADVQPRSFTMSPEDIHRLNPNTGTAPLFRSPRDARITLNIYCRVPVLWLEKPEKNPWNLSFMAMLHMANDSGIFRTRQELERGGWLLVGNVFMRGEGAEAEYMVPLVEAKMVHHFDHRLGTYEGQTRAQAKMGALPRLTPDEHADSTRVVLPRYWVAEGEVEKRLLRKRWDKAWLLGWRDIARSSDGRTVISSIIPRLAVGDKFLLMLVPDRAALLQANLASFVLDYSARQKFAGTSFKYFLMKQLPVLPPERYDEPVGWLPGGSLAAWVQARVLELTYTAWDLEAFARDMGDPGPPFVWDDQRRFELRAELDAAYFRLYGVARADVAYVMDGFRAFRNNDPDRFERTKARILAAYDAMAEAEGAGVAYVSPLDPVPGAGRRHPEAPGRLPLRRPSRHDVVPSEQAEQPALPY